MVDSKRGLSAKYEHTSKFTLASQRSFQRKTNNNSYPEYPKEHIIIYIKISFVCDNLASKQSTADIFLHVAVYVCAHCHEDYCVGDLGCACNGREIPLVHLHWVSTNTTLVRVCNGFMC